jgi:ABC-2 type transport system ATP-binding protein
MDMIDLIREISTDYGINILVSSHLLPDIEATCEYATILNQGIVVSQGRIAELTGQEAKSEEDRLMNVRIKGKLNVFLEALAEKGIKFTVEDKIIQIPFKDENPSQIIIEVAYNTGVQIRSMTPRKAILEDVFIHKIEGNTTQNQEIGGQS